MYSDDKMVLQLLSLLKKNNIRRIVISPGSRDFALIHSFEADSFFKLYSVVDERSAAFFALGVIQQTGEVCAVCCSSGTACMNYGSAIVEAYYQKLPLLVLSADRLPEYLNQLEDQMYDQLDTFKNCTKYAVQLPVVESERDEWYCNRLINEAIIELTHHGRGPVHINIPFLGHGTFQTTELPDVRKISLTNGYIGVDQWKNFSDRLKNKKVLIIWGQSVVQSVELFEAVDSFVSKIDAVILTDNMANCKSKYAITNTLSVLLSIGKSKHMEFLPDVIISIGGNNIFNQTIKPFLSGAQFEHWLVGEEGKVCDSYRKLTEIFEMPEYFFFRQIAANAAYTNNNGFRQNWMIASDKCVLPENDYNEMYAIGKLMSRLPANSDLQIANSFSSRMAHYYKVDSHIRVNCNRGVNGIDGSMSTAIGFSADNSRPTFLIIGDLSFFYDMNSLWIRHIGRNLRILLINNGGGALLYRAVTPSLRDSVGPHVAAYHDATAKGWVESRGIRYFSATNKEECDAGLDMLFDAAIEQPILLEVFTSIKPDAMSMDNYAALLDRRTASEKSAEEVSKSINLAKGKLKKLFGK